MNVSFCAIVSAETVIVWPLAPIAGVPEQVAQVRVVYPALPEAEVCGAVQPLGTAIVSDPSWMPPVGAV